MIKTATKAGRCPRCNKMVEIGEEYSPLDCGAFVRKCHPKCAEELIENRRLREKKKEEKGLTGGKAGSFHESGGRVIRGTNST